jgi:hypothetical protein
MTRSTKLGIASAAMLVMASVLAMVVPQLPLGLAAAFVSVVLGLLAAWQGSKWWLLMPGIVIAAFGIGLWAGFHAR